MLHTVCVLSCNDPLLLWSFGSWGHGLTGCKSMSRVGTALDQIELIARHQELNVCQGAAESTVSLVLHSMGSSSRSSRCSNSTWGHHLVLVVGAAVSSWLDHQCNPCK